MEMDAQVKRHGLRPLRLKIGPNLSRQLLKKSLTKELTLVGGLSKYVRQPRTPSARSDTRPPPPSLILTGQSTFWPANVREGRPKNAYFCPPSRVNQLDPDSTLQHTRLDFMAGRLYRPWGRR